MFKAPGDFLKTFRDTAATLGLGRMVESSELATEAREEKRAEEARKRGKRRKGQPYGSIIRYERLGPYYRQEGVEIINMPSGTVAHKPRLRQYFVHRFLHATKGWRSSTHVPAGMRGA